MLSWLFPWLNGPSSLWKRSSRRSRQREEGEPSEDFTRLIRTLTFVHLFNLFLYPVVPTSGMRGPLLLCFVPGADTEVATPPTALGQS